jgi:hypothetical protein
MDMAQVESINQSYMDSGYYANGDVLNCTHHGMPTMGTFSSPKVYEKVVSERRTKPRKKFLRPNYFKVHKFYADANYGATARVCFKPLPVAITVTQNRCNKRPSLKTSPQELCALHQGVTNEAIVAAYAEANGAAIFDMAPVLFEAAETLSYIKNVLKGGRLLVTNLPSAFRNAKKAVKSPESLWLEYRYAIMPLILTVSDAIEAYKGGVSRRTYDSRVEVPKVKQEYVDPSWRYGTLPNGLYDIRNEVVDSVTSTCRLYVRSQCDPAPLGLGLFDMLRGSWEVVPLSFVLDWIVGVQNWLTSMRDTQLELDASYVTTVVNRRGEVRSYDYSDMEWQEHVRWGYDEYMMERITDPQLPNLPVLQNGKLSLLRTVDAITLLLSIMKGFLTRK